MDLWLNFTKFYPAHCSDLWSINWPSPFRFGQIGPKIWPKFLEIYIIALLVHRFGQIWPGRTNFSAAATAVNLWPHKSNFRPPSHCFWPSHRNGQIHCFRRRKVGWDPHRNALFAQLFGAKIPENASSIDAVLPIILMTGPIFPDIVKINL